MKRKLLWARLAHSVVGVVIMGYLYKVVVARAAWDSKLFLVLLTLGVFAFLLNVKGLIESKSDLEKQLNPDEKT